jgi:hypothetical protein
MNHNSETIVNEISIPIVDENHEELETIENVVAENQDMILNETFVEEIPTPIVDENHQELETIENIVVENQDMILNETNVDEKVELIEEEKLISEIKPSSSEIVQETEIIISEEVPFLENDKDEAIAAIEEVNAEENEEDSLEEETQLPMKDYESLTMEQLFDELSHLNSIDKVATVKNHVEEVRKSFLTKYYQLIDEKKAEFYNENPDSTEEFQYDLPLKNTFDQLYNQYRDRKNTYFQSIQDNLKNNLKVRLGLVEELKNLVHNQESIPVTLKKFNDIRDRWKVAGPIPKDKYNHVWNNYHFHLENFYDILHLDREIRDLDFKHNLVQKLKIIERLEELVKEDDINKSFRELQVLHKVWKEQIGPVSREHREETWNRFSELTRQLHDRRELHLEKIRAVENENLEKKKGFIAAITELSEEKLTSHAAWQKQLEKS